MGIRVLVAVDEALVRHDIRSALRPQADIEVLGNAATCQEALTKAVALRPDVVLVDATLAGRDGTVTARSVKACCPETHILMLVRHAERALPEVGVDGYVFKDISPATLVNAIRTVHRASMAGLAWRARGRGTECLA